MAPFVSDVTMLSGGRMRSTSRAGVRPVALSWQAAQRCAYSSCTDRLRRKNAPRRGQRQDAHAQDNVRDTPPCPTMNELPRDVAPE